MYKNMITDSALSAALGETLGVSSEKPEGVHPDRWKAMVRCIIRNEFQVPDNTRSHEVEWA